MPKLTYPRNVSTFAGIALFCCLAMRSDVSTHPAARMAVLPRVTFWAWERREDLHILAAHDIAVAYLDRTLTVGLNVQSQVRRDPLWLPASTARMPVVRIETTRSPLLNRANLDQTVAALLISAREPGIAALQIDFDATRSQRPFYRSLLLEVRRQMPAGVPLSITALASWCSWDRWLQGLPIDEAVPMMFRMEPDHRRAPQNLSDFRLREPLCATSVGISTTEVWPTGLSGKRVYVFSDKGWRQDSALDIERKLQ